jgi:hypothetical protein
MLFMVLFDQGLWPIWALFYWLDVAGYGWGFGGVVVKGGGVVVWGVVKIGEFTVNVFVFTVTHVVVDTMTWKFALLENPSIDGVR